MVGKRIKSYRDLVVWRRAVLLVRQIYALTATFPRHEAYGLTSQLRRAAVSVPSNIAEGQSRFHTGEFRQFLYVAVGSLAELDTQLIIAFELGYASPGDCAPLLEEVAALRKMLRTLISHLPKA